MNKLIGTLANLISSPIFLAINSYFPSILHVAIQNPLRQFVFEQLNLFELHCDSTSVFDLIEKCKILDSAELEIITSS